VRFLQGDLFARRDPAGSQPAAHGLQFGHHLEHFTDPVGADFRHGRAAPRLDLDQPDRRQLDQGFTHRRPRDAEGVRQFLLVEPRAGRVDAGHDAFLDQLAEAF